MHQRGSSTLKISFVDQEVKNEAFWPKFYSMLSNRLNHFFIVNKDCPQFCIPLFFPIKSWAWAKKSFVIQTRLRNTLSEKEIKNDTKKERVREREKEIAADILTKGERETERKRNREE